MVNRSIMRFRHGAAESVQIEVIAMRKGVVLMLLAVVHWDAIAQVSSGTAFAVGPGMLVTNQHVVEGCASIEVIASDGRRPASVVDAESQIDLALLRVYGLRGGTARLRNPRSVRLGESAHVFGFPLTGSLSSEGNFTSGVVSALRGLRDAAGELQITAPIQPGNSGGPLMDSSGLIIGVVQSKLDAMRTVKSTGDIPQNVNFAISLDVLADFLAKNKVNAVSAAPSVQLNTARIAESAQSFTYRVECRERANLLHPPAATPPKTEIHPPVLSQPSSPPPKAPFSTFQDCDICPEMVVIPVGVLSIGRRTIEISRPFAFGRFELTLAQWDACFSDGDCKHWPSDEGTGRRDQPARNVSWEDAKQFTKWLSRKTGQSYRLPTEAEWEYAARANTTTKYYWGDNNMNSNYSSPAYFSRLATLPRRVGVGAPNAWGIYDVLGNVWEWVEDCWQSPIRSFSDQSARITGNCEQRVIRGGGFDTMIIDSNTRGTSPVGDRYHSIGFRLTRSID
mgnify:CR=1 FL=1